mmetsp:Transcript_1699/g.4279  ORF Transcript_1699/g.4279 Transcript_1699/m.4279 type:complete len:208 (-) Transcript_1699:151-774(-)
MRHLARRRRRQHHLAGGRAGGSRREVGTRHIREGRRGRRRGDRGPAEGPPRLHHLPEAHQHQAPHRGREGGPVRRPRDGPAGSGLQDVLHQRDVAAVQHAQAGTIRPRGEGSAVGQRFALAAVLGPVSRLSELDRADQASVAGADGAQARRACGGDAGQWGIPRSRKVRRKDLLLVRERERDCAFLQSIMCHGTSPFRLLKPRYFGR